MIQHILKIIWNERRINAWLLLEYVVVFCILWFCCDFLYYIINRKVEPTGFNTEHVYLIKMGIKKAESLANTFTQLGETEKKQDKLTIAMTAMDRIKRYPAVEEASFSKFSIPHINWYSSAGYVANSDSVNRTLRRKAVTPDFFKVFKMNMAHGRVFDWEDALIKKQVIITPDDKDKFGPYPASEVKTVRMGFLEGDLPMEVVGVLEKLKNSDYDPYTNIVFIPLPKEELDLRYVEIAVRVHPEADKNFKENFARDMEEQLNIGGYYLSSVVSFNDLRQIGIEGSGLTNDLNGIFSITAFIIINIFFGIIGTFWFRTQSRRSEIGLRIALGASKQKVSNTIMAETVLLLFVSSVIAVVICANVATSDLLESLGIPQAMDLYKEANYNRPIEEPGGSQYIINYILTFLFLAIISLAAVLYPARQASNIPPADALREE